MRHGTVNRRTLGRSGLVVSAIGLGCMGLSDSSFYGHNRDEAEASATLDRALDLGLDFVDTSDMYGSGGNERFLGRAIRGRRNKIVLATKFGFVRAADRSIQGIYGGAEYVRSACEASLQRLGVDTIDLYYQHRVDPSTPIEETVGAMAELVRAGKVRFLGLSEASAATLRRACTVHPMAALQSEYSLWTRDVETGILPACRDLGVGFVAYGPLGYGFFTSRTKAAPDPPESQALRTMPRFNRDNFHRNRQLALRAGSVAERQGCTLAQLAIGWLLAMGDDIVPIPGASKRAHLEENVAALDITLGQPDLEELDRLFPPGAAFGPRASEEAMQTLDR